jgi:RNA polymerase sigma-70 factor (ECF subfamily)
MELGLATLRFGFGVLNTWPMPAFAPTERADTTGIDAAMDRYASGDDAAFDALYNGLSPRLFAFLVRMTRDAARAEDLVQQTFLQMHRARGRFVRGAEVLPWAFAIARRLFIDGTRRGRREVLSNDSDADRANEPASPDASGEEILRARELAAAISKVVATLPEAQRVAFELIKWEGLSVAQVAQVTGASVTATKLRAHRAYEALREALGEKADDVIPTAPIREGAK